MWTTTSRRPWCRSSRRGRVGGMGLAATCSSLAWEAICHLALVLETMSGSSGCRPRTRYSRSCSYAMTHFCSRRPSSDPSSLPTRNCGRRGTSSRGASRAPPRASAWCTAPRRVPRSWPARVRAPLALDRRAALEVAAERPATRPGARRRRRRPTCRPPSTSPRRRRKLRPRPRPRRRPLLQRRCRRGARTRTLLTLRVTHSGSSPSSTAMRSPACAGVTRSTARSAPRATP
mmetsp:Transcript_48447/g.137567  ORF Transcript_48447/g.137567 Transcript_48447/m.137567 type:complete len:232 (-) Transcript_48447:758-1453(-)